MTIQRNVAFGQFRGCLFVHIGATAILLPILRGDRSWGLEVATPLRWFGLRPWPRLTWRR